MIFFGFFLWMFLLGKGIVKCYRYICCEYYSFVDKIRLCIEEIYSSCQESYNCDYLVLLFDLINNFYDILNEEKI